MEGLIEVRPGLLTILISNGRIGRSTDAGVNPTTIGEFLSGLRRELAECLFQVDGFRVEHADSCATSQQDSPTIQTPRRLAIGLCLLIVPLSVSISARIT